MSGPRHRDRRRPDGLCGDPPGPAQCYSADDRIVRTTSGAEALAVLTKPALCNQPVASIASDQRMPEMTGIDMLEEERTDLVHRYLATI
jgi:CheY-like chemotaxis protein